MSAEAKFFPRSNPSRLFALTTAKNLNDSLPGPSLLMPKTEVRLNAIQPLFELRLDELTLATARFSKAAARKLQHKTATALFASHFIQAFDMGVRRGKFPAAHRAFFGLPVEHNRLPRLIQDYEIADVATRLVEGDAQRLAAGGEPMSNPDTAELAQHLALFRQADAEVNEARLSLIAAQQAVRDLHREVNGVIKKIWGEIEAHFNELSAEQKRHAARQWGLVYARKGNLKQVEGVVTHALTQQPLAHVKLKLLNGRNPVHSRADGTFQFNTTLMHRQPLLAVAEGFADAEVMIDLHENQNTFCAIRLQPLS